MKHENNMEQEMPCHQATFYSMKKRGKGWKKEDQTQIQYNQEKLRENRGTFWKSDRNLGKWGYILEDCKGREMAG